MFKSERWRQVVGYEGWYDVSNRGRVKRVKASRGTSPNRILKPHFCIGGYQTVCLSMHQKVKQIRVHRLVAIAFIPNPKNKPEINHKNGNRLKNWDTNLEWATRRENALHSCRILGHNLGDRNGRSKLKNSEVIEIKKILKTNAMTQRAIAKIYSVDFRTINNINQGRRWASV